MQNFLLVNLNNTSTKLAFADSEKLLAKESDTDEAALGARGQAGDSLVEFRSRACWISGP